MTAAAVLSEGLVERILERLDLRSRPDVSREGLATLYSAWCQRVPFDNVRKLIYLRSGASGPLPGDDPAAFFEA